MKRASKLSLFLAFLLSACSHPLQMKFNASSHLNPDDLNQSLPVEVVIYQLRDEQTFKQATFQELWQQDTATLGDSLLSRREISIAPGTKIKINIDRNNETQFIGVVAIFRNPEGNEWRAIKKIGRKIPLVSKHLTITLQKNQVRLN